MITVHGITKEDINNLYQMYYDYYRGINGVDWTINIPIKKIRDFLDLNKIYAELSVKEVFSKTTPNGMITKDVLGLYDEQNLIGFACVGIFDDLTGGIYHIYVKPEYRKAFINNFKDEKCASEYLMEGIQSYFMENQIKKVELEVPHHLHGIKRLVRKAGFVNQQNYYDAASYTKER